MFHRQPPWANGTAPPPQPEPMSGPIISETRWKGKLASARAHVAVVVVYYRGDHQVLWPHDRRRVLLHRRPTTMYEVDLGVHHTAMSADLPSNDRAGSFHASISVQWRVLDPSAVVRHRVSDVDKAISAHLLRRARSIAREFRIGQAAAAEDEINTRLGSLAIDVTAPDWFQQAMREAAETDRLGAEYGLWTRVIVELTLDEAAIEHNTKMTKLTWAIEEEEAEQRLRLLQETNQRKIMADRITVYREIVAAGDIERFALQLANNPDDIAAIATIIRDDQLESRRDTIDFVAHMVDSGVIERWEVSDQAREALQWLREATARVIRDRGNQKDINQTNQQSRRGRDEPIEGSTEPPAALPNTTSTASGPQTDTPSGKDVNTG